MNKFMPVLVFLSAVFFAASTFIFFGGFDPNRFNLPAEQPFITPAVYTFAIWAVIYAWLIIGTFLQWRRHGNSSRWEAMRLPLIVSMLVGSTWVYSLSGSALISTIIIVLMWLGAFLSIIRTPSEDPWIGIYPDGFYLGWLSAATGVSLGTWLFAIGLSNLMSSIIGLIVAAALALYVIGRAPLVVSATVASIWGLVGIVVNNFGAQGSMPTALLAGIGAVILGVFAYQKRNSAA